MKLLALCLMLGMLGCGASSPESERVEAVDSAKLPWATSFVKFTDKRDGKPRILCSLDGKYWFLGRDDGMCYKADSANAVPGIVYGILPWPKTYIPKELR